MKLNYRDIADEYETGISLKHLAIKYATNVYLLKKELSKLIEIRGKSKRNLVDLELIKELYLAGNTAYQIAKYTLVSEATVRKYLRELDVEIRPANHIRKYNINDDYFETIDTKDKAYWLGWMFSDGYVVDNKICIALNNKDEYILHLFAKYLEAENYNVTRHKSNNSVRLVFSSTKMCNDLAKYGVIQNKSLQLKSHLPANTDLVSHFVRGVFNGDGSIGFIKGKKANHNKSLRFRICGGSYSFLETIRDYLVSNLNIPENKITKAKNKTLWNIEYGGNPICRTIYEWLYKDCGELYLVRKKEKYDEFIKTYTSIIDSNYTSTKQLTQTRTKLVNLYIKEHKEFILDKLQEQEPNTTRHALRIWVNRYLKKLMIIN